MSAALPKYLDLVALVESTAAKTGAQMNPMRARQMASKLYHGVVRYLHVSAPIVERKDETTGVVRRFVQKPGRTYRRPS